MKYRRQACDTENKHTSDIIKLRTRIRSKFFKAVLGEEFNGRELGINDIQDMLFDDTSLVTHLSLMEYCGAALIADAIDCNSMVGLSRVSGSFQDTALAPAPTVDTGFSRKHRLLRYTYYVVAAQMKKEKKEKMIGFQTDVTIR